MAARKRLENRILLLAILILVVAFGALAVVNIVQVTSALESQSMHESRAVAASAALGIRTLMRSAGTEEEIKVLLPKFVDEVRETRTVEDVHLFNLAAAEPFRPTDRLENALVVQRVKEVLATGEDRNVETRDTTYYLKPVVKEAMCDECHAEDPPGTKVRGVVAVAISKSQSAAALRANTIFMTLSALVTIVLVIVGVKLVTRRFVTAPLSYLTEVSDGISKGNLDTEVKVASRDEVGLLAESIERLRVSMKLAMDRLKKGRDATRPPT